MKEIIKPYEWTGSINGKSPEISKKCWDNLWEFINNLDILEEITTMFKNNRIYKCMEYIELKYPYNDGEVFESLFDGVNEEEFSYYIEKKYGIKSYCEYVENWYIE